MVIANVLKDTKFCKIFNNIKFYNWLFLLYKKAYNIAYVILLIDLVLSHLLNSAYIIVLLYFQMVTFIFAKKPNSMMPFSSDEIYLVFFSNFKGNS